MMTASRASLLVPLLLALGVGCDEGLAGSDSASTDAGASGSSSDGSSNGSSSNGSNGSSNGSSNSGSSSNGNNGSSSGNNNGTGNSGSTTTTGAGLNIDISQTSVSGLSAGGYFAVQFHVAFSSIMKGAAIFAGGPYDCAQGSLTTALTTCTNPLTAPDVTPLVAATKSMATAGTIDDPSNLSSQHVFLFGGADDTTVSPVVVDSLNTFYGSFMSTSSIQYESRYAGASHTMPTTSYGNACSVSMSPWVSNCSYDGAGKALAQIYGSLNPAASTPGGTYLSIPQGNFISDPASHSLADTAYAYIPQSCANGEQCKVHISFHGCEQEVSSVSDAYYKHAGFNEWADTNHIVVLYPQTIASEVSPSNPDACWDWWGYDSTAYATKTGSQMAMVRAMLDALVSGTGISDAGAD